MAIVMRMFAPGATREQYEQVNASMGISGDEDGPDGLIQHIAGLTPDGVVVIDVWESEEKLNKFFEEKAGPALAAAGVNAGQPEIHKLHNMIPRGTGTEPNVIVEISMDAGPEVYDGMASSMPTHVGDGSGHPVYSHVAAATSDGGMYVVDLWDSPESFGQFAAAEIAPAAGDRMDEIQPTFTPVIAVLHGKAAVTA